MWRIGFNIEFPSGISFHLRGGQRIYQTEHIYAYIHIDRPFRNNLSFSLYCCLLVCLCMSFIVLVQVAFIYYLILLLFDAYNTAKLHNDIWIYIFLDQMDFSFWIKNCIPKIFIRINPFTIQINVIHKYDMILYGYMKNRYACIYRIFF